MHATTGVVEKMLAQVKEAPSYEDAFPTLTKLANTELRYAIGQAFHADDDDGKPVIEPYMVNAPNAKAKSMIVTAIASTYNVRVLGDVRLVEKCYRVRLIGYPSDIAIVKRLSEAILTFAESEAERLRLENPGMHGKSFKQSFYTEFGVKLAEHFTSVRADALKHIRPNRAMAFHMREVAVQEKVNAAFGARLKPGSGSPAHNGNGNGNGHGPSLKEATEAELVAELSRRVGTKKATS